MAAFCVAAQCSLVCVYQRFRGPSASIFRMISKFIQVYTALQPRRQPSSNSVPSELQILLTIMWSFYLHLDLQTGFYPSGFIPKNLLCIFVSTIPISLANIKKKTKKSTKFYFHGLVLFRTLEHRRTYHTSLANCHSSNQPVLATSFRLTFPLS
jgi:hypothetical protein